MMTVRYPLTVLDAYATSFQRVLLGDVDCSREDWMDCNAVGNQNSDEATGVLDNALPESVPTSRLPAEDKLPGPQSPDKLNLSPCNRAPAYPRCSGQQPSIPAKSHSIVEKHYRTNFNQKLRNLGQCLAKLRLGGTGEGQDDPPSETQRYNKATVLTEAMAYIRYLEQRNACHEEANRNLQRQHGPKISQGPHREGMVKCENGTFHATDASDNDNQSGNHHEGGSPQIGSSVDTPPERSPAEEIPQGLIKVAEEFRRM